MGWSCWSDHAALGRLAHAIVPARATTAIRSHAARRLAKRP